MKKICIYFGSSTGFTEMASERILSSLPENTCDVFNAVDDSLSCVEPYSLIFFGIPTWDYGGLQEDWQTRWDELNKLNLASKYVAIFGMGDQLGYGAWFQDAMGRLHDALLEKGATPLGYWENSGYIFTQSRAITENGDFFVGLSLDDTNQADLTMGRIVEWTNQVIHEYQQLTELNPFN